MTTAQYFRQARSIGPFTAQDCLALARRAAQLDLDAEIAKIQRPIVAYYEVLPDGSGYTKFSNGITVY